MRNRKSRRVHERRKKRMIIPAVYFVAEVVLSWLILSLIQLNFNINTWSIWSLLIFIAVVVYSMFKTIHVYRRQRNYTNSDEVND